MNEEDLDLDKIKDEFLRQDLISSNFINSQLQSLTQPRIKKSKVNDIDYSWIDFDYLSANSKNINFHREKEYLYSSNLEEKLSLEEELFFDLDLTYQDKKILLVDNSTREPKCKFCPKKFKIAGKALNNHENNCFFNPIIAVNISLKDFKQMSLRRKKIVLNS